MGQAGIFLGGSCRGVVGGLLVIVSSFGVSLGDKGCMCH